MAKQKRLKVLEAEQLNAILDLASDTDPRGYAMLKLMQKTGARIGEMLSMKASDVKREYIDVDGKSGYRRIWLPQHRSLFEAMDRWEQLRSSYQPSEFYFCCKNGNRVSLVSFSRSLKRWSYELWGGEVTEWGNYQPTVHVNPHQLRHTWATDRIEEGWSVQAVSNVLGHKNTNITTRVYSHALERHGKEAMRRWQE